MLICTYYTPTHKKMANDVYEYHSACGFSDMLMWDGPQTCPSGSFKQHGWNFCTAQKYRHLSEMEPDFKKVLFVDADVAIFPGLAEWCWQWLEDNPNCIGFGDDIIQKCTGVMLFERSPEVLDWFMFCYAFCSVMHQNDQDGLQIIESIADQLNVPRLPIKLEKLPGEIISNWAHLGARSPWEGEPIDVPESTLLWHANWCVGVKNKMEMLTQVKNSVCPEMVR